MARKAEAPESPKMDPAVDHVTLCRTLETGQYMFHPVTGKADGGDFTISDEISVEPAEGHMVSTGHHMNGAQGDWYTVKSAEKVGNTWKVVAVKE